MIEKNLQVEHPDKQRAEQALIEREEQLRALVENTPDVITRWDDSLKLVFANAAFVEKTGTDVSYAIGKTCIGMGMPVDIAQAYMDKLRMVFATGRPQEHYNYFPSPDGLVHFHSRIVPEYDIHGKVYTVLGIARDITHTRNVKIELDELNRRLLHKDRVNEALMDELGTFTRIIGGQYADALQKAYTSLEFLINNDARNFSNEGRASLRRVQSSLQRMKLMTADLVAFSSIEADEASFSAVELNQVLDIVRGEMEEKLTRSKVTVTADTLPVINGYAMLVSLLFYHLLDNAVKFTRPGVKPVVAVKYNSIDSRDLSYHVISFKDNGIGFEEGRSDKIFELFSRHEDRQRYKGSGIGLAVCKKIMDRHGGLITTESNPGEGSLFSCWFPR
ncbi:ATP-binding protein [Chitinophaga sedimenti]|uniref:sensor histidine kinase n=1 Tax=Chitinophaga sedimenti TaxID=2033606 RepID=UPI002006D5BE|nr:PAS domain-containing sensor histidine kinase [Chitinophaga sedimenti]MCK7556626.1 ATP-binding protein [Chitinophaga sedimenti]